MGRYLIKCDICKKTIRTTNDVEESYAGGTCEHCRYAYQQEKSLAQAMRDGDNKLVKDIERKAKSGTMVRLF